MRTENQKVRFSKVHKSFELFNKKEFLPVGLPVFYLQKIGLKKAFVIICQNCLGKVNQTNSVTLIQSVSERVLL